MQKNKKMYKISDVARDLRVSRQTVYEWIEKEILPCIELPSGQVRIPRKELQKFLDLRKNKSCKKIAELLYTDDLIALAEPDNKILINP